jgi:hypothetical protein
MMMPRSRLLAGVPLMVYAFVEVGRPLLIASLT